MTVKSICGVILAAKDPEALAGFYSKALGLDFQREEHGDLDVHYGVDIGELHFGIHPASNLHGRPAGRSATGLAFDVDDVESVAGRLEELGARNLAPLHDEGFGPVATYEDPEGNHFEIVKLRYDFGA